MRKDLALGALLVAGVVGAANAQEMSNPQTLENQMQRVLSGQPAVPATWNEDGQNAAAPAKTAPAQNKANREWPASAAAPAAGTSQQVVMKSVAPDGEIINSIGGNAIPALPLEIRTVGDIRYITGGVGDEEKEQLKMVENDYNVRILIAGNSGAFISGAVIRIMDKDGKILLSTDGAGPYVYAAMPAGVYDVEVTAPEGGIKSTKVTVPASGVVKPVMRFTE